MPTIRDVARQAGVAPITVSRVINNSGYVSEQTRQRVETAIAELGYVPNMLGPSLRFQQTNTLALVLTDISNPFWTTVARGAEDAASENSYSLILCNTDESEVKQEEYMTMLLRRRIDGLLLAPAGSDTKSILLAQKQGMPVVVLDRRIPELAVDVVRVDSEEGAYQLARHLLDLGHKQIAMLTGPAQVSTAVDRVAGYRRALVEAGLPEDAAQIHWGVFTLDSGYEMTEQALTAVPYPTALFAANNFIAIGALRALQAAGLAVPKDISLVSFDDLPAALTIEPFLTAVRHPAYDIGYQAAQLLLSRIAGEAPDACQEIVLPTKLVIRRSSGGKI